MAGLVSLRRRRPLADDNNPVEREMKSIAIGRKTCLFFGSDRRYELDVWQ